MVCRPEDLRIYADLCRNNISALLNGTTPNCYAFGSPDGNVSGVILTLHCGENIENFSQVSLRPGMPLQTGLFSLCKNAAQVLADRHANGEVPAEFQVSVAILHDPVPHGTVSDHDLNGVDPGERAILVLERNKSGLVFNPAQSPAESVAEAASQAQVTHPAGAPVFSLDILARCR